MSAPFVAVRHQRSLGAVYRFYDAFMLPLDDRTPALGLPLAVSIPSLTWQALRVADDASYRFSAATLTHPSPGGVNLDVLVFDPAGLYQNLEAIKLNLPVLPSVPPRSTDFLVQGRLWPTTAMRPPAGEMAVRGLVSSPTAQPVDQLLVEMWTGPSPVPPAGTPFTRSNARGEFVFRFPLLKAVPGQALPVHIRLDGGLVPVLPALPVLTTGQTQIVSFQRT